MADDRRGVRRDRGVGDDLIPGVIERKELIPAEGRNEPGFQLVEVQVDDSARCEAWRSTAQGQTLPCGGGWWMTTDSDERRNSKPAVIMPRTDEVRAAASAGNLSHRRGAINTPRT